MPQRMALPPALPHRQATERTTIGLEIPIRS